MTDESDWGHGPNDPVPTYFEEQIRMALDDFFDGDHQKVQAVIDHLKRVAEKFEPPPRRVSLIVAMLTVAASRRINPSFSRQAERGTPCFNSLHDTKTQRAPRLRLPQCSRRRAMR
jgi:hypothetical protein